jgi:hypothetical protein
MTGSNSADSHGDLILTEIRKARQRKLQPNKIFGHLSPTRASSPARDPTA